MIQKIVGAYIDRNGKNINRIFYTEELTDVGSRRLTAEQKFKIEPTFNLKDKGKRSNCW